MTQEKSLFESGRRICGAPQARSKDRTNLFFLGDQVGFQKRDTAGPLVQTGKRLRLDIGAHAFRRDGKCGCKLQGLVRRQESHLERILLSGYRYCT